MRNQPGIAAVLTLVLLAASLPATRAHAQGRLFTRPARPAASAAAGPSFILSGEFSGIVAGQLIVDGKPYRLSPEANIYEVGKGAVPIGTAYSNRIVFISGVQTSGAAIVSSVIVRPARNMALAGVDMSVFVHVKADGGPR